MSHVLIVEDDLRTMRLMQMQLNGEGTSFSCASSGSDALAMFKAQPPDLVVLDLNLPDISGIEVCRRVRAVASTPILFVSAVDAPATKAAALYSGADDYVVKPVDGTELQARVAALMRRGGKAGKLGTAGRRIGTLTLDASRWVSVSAGGKIRLTKLEAAILECMADTPDGVVTYNQILDQVWGPGHTDIRPVHAHVSNLSRKLRLVTGGVSTIASAPGVGYRFMV